MAATRHNVARGDATQLPNRPRTARARSTTHGFLSRMAYEDEEQHRTVTQRRDTPYDSGAHSHAPLLARLFFACMQPRYALSSPLCDILHVA
jgi:ribosomal protein L34